MPDWQWRRCESCSPWRENPVDVWCHQVKNANGVWKWRCEVCDREILAFKEGAEVKESVETKASTNDTGEWVEKLKCCSCNAKVKAGLWSLKAHALSKTMCITKEFMRAYDWTAADLKD